MYSRILDTLLAIPFANNEGGVANNFALLRYPVSGLDLNPVFAMPDFSWSFRCIGATNYD
jgi:hypothetical protein